MSVAAPGQLGDHLEIAARPHARAVVDRAEGAEHVPAGLPDREAGVGDHAEVGDRAVVREALVEPGVLDDQRGAVLDDVLAEGVGERRLAALGDGGREAALALEELAVRRHQGDEATGTPRIRDARFVSRSKTISAGVSSSAADSSARRRCGSVRGESIGGPSEPNEEPSPFRHTDNP
jgi:hypothetical protein